jgi:hypothetical protein
MTTAVDLITLALKDIGVLGIGQSISPEDTADALATLNMMLGQWQGERLSVYHEIDVSKQATGAASYTIGAGGDFNVTRPTDIKAAFVRLANGTIPVDYPVDVIRSREDYDLITAKSIQSLPNCVYYDASYPLGTLMFYPVPNAQYELHVSVLDALPQFDAPAAAINLPPEYMAAIRYNLAVYLAPSYQLEPSPSLQRLAANAKRIVKRMNTQIPSMTMPSGVLGVAGRYNVYGDTYNR